MRLPPVLIIVGSDKGLLKNILTYHPILSIALCTLLGSMLSVTGEKIEIILSSISHDLACKDL